jgi:hypothetical protein
LRFDSCIYVYAYACGGKNGAGRFVDGKEFETVCKGRRGTENEIEIEYGRLGLLACIDTISERSASY